jgi:carboxyl-terminal processing protease
MVKSKYNNKLEKEGFFVKKHFVRRAISLACSIAVVLLLAGQPVFASDSVRDDSSYFIRLMDMIQDQYYGEATDDMLLEGAVRGMFGLLDDYTRFMDRQERDDFYGTIGGNFGGIGATLQKNGEYIVVTNVYRGSPAEKAGISQGDIIVEADGISLIDVSVDTAADIIRGDPGTKVKLGVFRSGDIVYIDIVREIVKVNPVIYENRDGIGYIRLEMFNSNTNEYIDSALKYFDRTGIDKIVLDLRDNPGGEMIQAVYLAEKFVTEGLITKLDYKSEIYQDINYYSGRTEQKYRLAVLVNGNSASASEIVAGAVQDRGAGKLVGTKTFGKAKFQASVPILTPDAYMKYKTQYGIDTVNSYELQLYGIYPGKDEIYGYAQMTMGLYYTPSGKMIDGVGITPDIQVEDPEYVNGIDIRFAEKLSASVILKPGSRGSDIYNAKVILKLLGYELENMDINFDEEFEAALKEYQSGRKIKASGILDIRTQATLNVDLNELIMKYDSQFAAAAEYLKN